MKSSYFVAKRKQQVVTFVTCSLFFKDREDH